MSQIAESNAYDQFLNPPREIGLMPFWFWNDNLEEAELRRQLHEFHRGAASF